MGQDKKVYMAKIKLTICFILFTWFTAMATLPSNGLLKIKKNSSKPKVLVFFDLGCPICIDYYNDIQEIAAQYSPGYNFYLIFTYLTDKDKILEDPICYNKNFQTFIDKRLVISKHYGVSVLPCVVVINNRNKIQYIGLIDDRFEQIGVKKSVSSNHYLLDVLNYKHHDFTVPVGCKFR